MEMVQACSTEGLGKLRMAPLEPLITPSFSLPGIQIKQHPLLEVDLVVSGIDAGSMLNSFGSCHAIAFLSSCSSELLLTSLSSAVTAALLESANTSFAFMCSASWAEDIASGRYVRSPVDIAKPISKRRTDLSALLDESQRQLKLALRSLWRVLFISEFSEHTDLFLDSLGKDCQGQKKDCVQKHFLRNWIVIKDASQIYKRALFFGCHPLFSKGILKAECKESLAGGLSSPLQVVTWYSNNPNDSRKMKLMSIPEEQKP
ncbi:hypothetical protein TURU_108110 [Turdus rufiventris]|nr:hypothetical protein TURU_108110 [Turdus rufiventris]